MKQVEAPETKKSTDVDSWTTLIFPDRLPLPRCALRVDDDPELFRRYLCGLPCRESCHLVGDCHRA
jgi:hypothetical protein